LSQLAFVLQNTPTRRLELHGLDASFHKVDSGRSRMDLSVWLSDSPDGLLGEWEYDTHLFDAEHISALADDLHRLLRQVATDPERRLADVDLIGEHERDRLLRRYNDTNRPEHAGHTVKDLFERQAHATPQAVAVVHQAASITYGDLEERSNRLARYLQKRGVGGSDKVAVCLPRSIDEIVAILAVIKSGAAYVPLGVDGPSARRDAMLAAVRPVALLSRGDLADEIWSPGRLILDLDDVDGELTALDGAPLASGPSPDDLAYTMFTSGSAGQPKGVEVTHGGFCNRIAWGQANFALTPEDRVLRRATSTFDVSLDELFRALFCGAVSVQMPESRSFDPARLVAVIEDQQITDVDLTPTVLAEIVRTQDLGRLRFLRKIVSGVEALPRALEQRVLRELDVSLFNIYGPTEVSVSCTSWRCLPTESQLSVPIGRPMSNTRVYVLDDQLRLVPPGVEGELYVSGVGLARGYLADPALTAERFVPDPFVEQPGARMYGTGDRVRWNESGALLFLGRLDDQVNVRGYRVEPSEVEAALRAHPAVDDAVVVPAPGPSGTSLIAYWTSDPSGRPTAPQLREFVRQRLPEYMAPHHLVELSSLPTNAHGKLDRSALPTPSPEHGDRAARAPSTDVERRLLEIWQQTLGRTDITVDDDFFDIGGDSVTATRIVAQACAELGKDMEVAEIFDNPNVAALAAQFEAAPVVAHAEPRRL